MSKNKKTKGDAQEEVLLNLQNALISEFGEGAAAPLSSPDADSRIKSWVSSGSIIVDSVLAGGREYPCSLVPYGRQMEISGKPGAGKTSLCAQIAAQVQKQGGIVFTIDTEERIDVPYWTSLGVDTSKVIRVEAYTLEEVFNKQESIIRNLMITAPGTPAAMIWDSIGGTSSDEIVQFDPKKKESFMDKAREAFGRDAKTIGLGVKGLNPLISRSKVAYIYTNHLYSKMNVGHGDPLETYGGEKLKFMATVRLRLKKIGQIKVDNAVGSEIIGNKVEVKAVKNSMAPKWLTMEGYVLGGKGFCNDYSVLELGSKLGLITGKASWKTVEIGGEEVKFQGWNGFQEKVVTHKDYEKLVKKIEDSIYKKLES